MTNYKYYFTLKGEDDLLTRSLAESGRSQDVVFFEDNSDVPDYYFSSVHLEGLSKESEVWDRATQLLKLYNAAHELTETTQALPRLHPSLGLQKLYIGTSTVPNFASGPMPTYQVEPFDVSIPPDNTKNGTSYGKLLYLARTEPEALAMLLLFTQATSMPEFYRAFESVGNALGKKNFEKKLGEEGLMDAFNSFQTTTNNYAIGKEHSRHGWPSPTNAKPRSGSKMPPAMTLEEAKTLAMKIGRLYFAAKYNFTFPASTGTAPAITGWPLIDEDF